MNVIEEEYLNWRFCESILTVNICTILIVILCVIMYKCKKVLSNNDAYAEFASTSMILSLLITVGLIVATGESLRKLIKIVVAPHVILINAEELKKVYKDEV